MKLPPRSVLAVLFASLGWSHAAKVYYINQPEGTPGIGVPGVIQVVNPDGTNHSAHYTATVPTDLRGIAVDPENNRLFFAYSEIAGGESSLRTMPLVLPGGGANPVTILTMTNGSSIADVEYDRTQAHVYFSQPGVKLLRRCDPSGGNLTDVLTHPGTGTLPRDLGPYFFGLDLVTREVYWAVLTTANDTNTAYSHGTLDGVVDPNFSLITPSRTRDIAVDPGDLAGARLYWNDRQNGAVYSRLAAGGTVTVVASGLNAPHGLALDLLARKGYVSDTGKRGSGSQASSHRVVRFSLDGTSAVEFLSPVSTVAEPWDVAFDPSSTTFVDWTRRFWSATTVIGRLPADDPDGDGLNNLAEYAFFTNPTTPDAAKVSQVMEMTPTGLRVAMRRNTNMIIRVEVSTDLTNWHWNGDGSGQTYLTFSAPTPRDEDSQWVDVAPAISGQSRLLYRMRALTP